jgi:catalase
MTNDLDLIEKPTQFTRERAPHRIVYAKGGGAHGFFEELGHLPRGTSRTRAIEFAGNVQRRRTRGQKKLR